MSLAKYSLDNTKIIYFFLAIMMAGGIIAFTKLAKKEDAPFVIKSVVLTTRYPGATPAEVEKLITEPIEREIQTLEGAYDIKSESFYGLSKINFELLPSTSSERIPQKWDELRRKVLNIQSSLPQGASQISVADDFGDVFGIYYALVADEGFTYNEMRATAQELKTKLSTVEGVVKVTLYGEQPEVVNVFMSIPTLANLGISPQQIANVISQENQVISAGEKNAGDLQMKIVSAGTYKDLEDIRNQTLTTSSGSQVRLGDYARIEKGYVEPANTLMRVNGKRAIGVGISSDTKMDVVLIGDRIKAKLEEINPTIPVGLTLTPIYLENEIAHEANNGFIINLVESILIVIIIIMLVMGARAGFLIGSSLLFSIGGAMLIMLFLNVGLNRTSLAGFIIAMGMLVDNAIVVTDNAQIAIMRGVNRRKALIDGASIPQWGLLGATFIAVASFLPLYLAPSAVAEIVKPLFVVLAISLGLSWILALTQTTTFGNFILKENSGGDAKDPYDKPLYHKFEALLSGLIRKRWLTIGATVGIFVVAMYIMGTMPQNFFPSMDKPFYRADLFLPEGYSINAVQKDVEKIEKHLLSNPEVKTVSVTMGSTPLRYYLASSSVGPKANFANILIELKSSDNTTKLEAEFQEYMDQNFPNIITRSSLFKLSPAVDAAIEIGFTGPDNDTLVMLTNKAMDLMHKYNYLRNIRNSWGDQIPVMEPVYSQDKGQRLGINRQALSQSIQMTSQGMNLGLYRENDLSMPILLKDQNIANSTLNNLTTLPVFNTKGKAIPLQQVIDSVYFGYEYNVIKRYNREKVMMAQCDPIRGQNAIAAFNQVWTDMQENIKVPVGYKMQYFGEKKSQDESNAALAANLPLTFMLIFITLLFLFGNYGKPMAIMLMVPLIFIGIVFGLFVLGKSFDFFAMLGLLGLIGMNIKNAIVLVDQIGIEVAAGLTPLDAVLSATKSRIVPVAMASGTTILGMLPLLFDAMFGGMAATIMGGLLVASLLTVLLLPVVYCTIYKIK